jgi:hypothetical protein
MDIASHGMKLRATWRKVNFPKLLYFGWERFKK